MKFERIRKWDYFESYHALEVLEYSARVVKTWFCDTFMVLFVLLHIGSISVFSCIKKEYICQYAIAYLTSLALINLQL